MIDKQEERVFRVGDRVRIKRGDCPYWGHNSEWCEDGKTAKISGTWRGHPGTDGEHHIDVHLYRGSMFVASLIFKESELELVRRGAGPWLHDVAVRQEKRAKHGNSNRASL